MKLDYPVIAGGSPQEQIQQLKMFLVQMVDTINLFIDEQERTNEKVSNDLESITNNLHRTNQSMDEQHQYTMKQIKGV